MQNNKSDITSGESKKRFLLVYIAMYTGGIETLILRMSDWLIENGHEVDILLVKNEGELLNVLNKKIKISYLGSFSELVFVNKYLFSKNRNEYDVIYSLSPVTIWMALVIGQMQAIKPVIINGVYHLYDFKIFGNTYTRRLFDSVLPDACKLFMTPYVKNEHEKILNRNIENPIIWPLPIKEQNPGKIKRNPKKFKLVSIGRITNFKTYNLYMLDVVKNLLGKGFPVEYFIYGDGELFEEVKEKIESLKLNKSVHLCGTVNYEKIPEILSEAYAFIGMGTSVIEAGMCKVPSIVAIAYSETAVTHGFVHHLPDYNSGEFRESDPVFSIEDELIALFNLENDQYNHICEESYVKLKEDYDLNNLMNDFLINIENIAKRDIKIPKIPVPYDYFAYKTAMRIITHLNSFYKKTKNSFSEAKKTNNFNQA